MRFALIALLLLPCTSMAQDPSKQTEDSSATFSIVETLPQFLGGEAALFRYLERHLVYPEEAIRAGVQGSVHVMFTVTADGRVDQVEVLRGVHPSIDAEIIRVVSSMPDWTPGTQHGKPVNVRYTMPVQFSLSRAQLRKAERRRRAGQ